MTTATAAGAPMTARQHEVCDHIRTFIARKGFGPSMREIGDALGMASTTAVMNHLRALERKGVIRRDPRTSRSIVLVDVPPPEARDRLAEALGFVLARLVAVKSEDGEGTVAYSGCFSRAERDFLMRSAEGGEGP